MKKKLTDREASLVARWLRIGMTVETIARVLKTSVSLIDSLIIEDDDCKQAVKLRAKEAAAAGIVAGYSASEDEDDYVSTAPEPPVMDAARDAVQMDFINIAALKQYIAERFDVTVKQMEDGTRNWRRARSREAAVCATKMMWPHLTLSEIGRHFGSRDHATIRHILKKHKLPTATVATGMKHAA